MTCWTEAASAQGSLPRVSSLGVSLGGLNFIPTLDPAEELVLQMILDFLSRRVDTILEQRSLELTLYNLFLHTIGHRHCTGAQVIRLCQCVTRCSC